MRFVLAIEMMSLTKAYSARWGRRGQEALRGVHLKVPTGTAFGLIGPNGAGKTTTVKCMLGIVRPSSGSVRLLGGDPSDPRVRARVGYLPERLQLPPTFSALEVLASVARLKRIRNATPAIEGLLEAVGLASEARRRVATYSKGMRQRLGLACALVGGPELLLLDEPTDGLDPLARVEIRNLLAAQLKRGATLFLNSHLLAETERLCTRIGILAAGRLVKEGALDALKETTQRWVVRFADGAPTGVLAAVGFTPGAPQGSWSFLGEADALNAALGEARSAGALLIELGRQEKDLEQVLAESIGDVA
jgi:ABC-2 type transport system ATP-binding protein